MAKYRNITREYRNAKNRDFITTAGEEAYAYYAKLRETAKDTGRYTSGGHYRDAKNGGSGQ